MRKSFGFYSFFQSILRKVNPTKLGTVKPNLVELVPSLSSIAENNTHHALNTEKRKLSTGVILELMEFIGIIALLMTIAVSLFQRNHF